MFKFEKEKDLFFCQVCIRAKQRQHSSYKTQLLANNICKKLHLDMMGLIIPVGWNGCRYTFIITNNHSRCRWVKNLYKIKETDPALRKFVTFIKN